MPRVDAPCVFIHSHAKVTEMQGQAATTAAAAEPLGTFVKLFVPFQIELASANARLDPSKERHKRGN